MSRAQIWEPCSPERSSAEPGTDPTPINSMPGSGGSAAVIRYRRHGHNEGGRDRQPAMLHDVTPEMALKMRCSQSPRLSRLGNTLVTARSRGCGGASGKMRARSMRPLMASLAVTLGLLSPARLEAASCESLATLTLPQTTVTAAEPIAAGAFVHRADLAGARTPPVTGRARVFLSGARLLPRRRHAHADQRFRHQDRSLAAGGAPPGRARKLCVERQVPGGRERRLAGEHSVLGVGPGGDGRLCRRGHRHRTRRQHGRIRARASGEGDRLRLSRRARDDGARQDGD